MLPPEYRGKVMCMNRIERMKENRFKKSGKFIFFIVSIWAILSIATSAWSQGSRGFLVETKWLADRLDDPNLVIIDASPTKQYLARHIKNAVSASFGAEEYLSCGIDTSYGGTDLISDPPSAMPWTDGSPEHIQEVMRSLGINNGSIVVIHDAGAFFHATRFFWTLTHHGHKNAFILNGGLSKWVSDGFPTVQAIPKAKRGNFVASVMDRSIVVNTEYVLAKLFKPDTVIVNAVGSDWHYGSYLAYSRTGHIPSSINAPYPDYFQKDKTWKPESELRRMFESLGMLREKEIIAYCGGNPAASLLYFTLRYVLGYPNVKYYTGSLTDWLKDERDLPLHTYQNEHLLRDPLWVQWWAGKRIQFLVRDPKVLTVDVRSKDKFNAGHIPYAVNIPINDLMNKGMSLGDWEKLLGDSGIGADTEVVLYDELNGDSSSLMFWFMEYLGHKQVSLLKGGLAAWKAMGLEVTTSDTIIAKPKTKYDVAISPKLYKSAIQPEKRLVNANDKPDFHGYPRIWILSSSKKRTVPTSVPSLDYRHIPWEKNLTESGSLKPAGQLITIYEEARIPMQSEIICYSDSIQEASFTYYVLRTLGYPRVRVYLSKNGPFL